MFTEREFQEKHVELSKLMNFPPIDNDPDVRDELRTDMVAETERMMALFRENDNDQAAEYDGEPHSAQHSLVMCEPTCIMACSHLRDVHQVW